MEIKLELLPLGGHHGLPQVLVQHGMVPYFTKLQRNWMNSLHLVLCECQPNVAWLLGWAHLTRITTPSWVEGCR